MTERQIFFVWGGVFTDAHFTDLQPGAEECYGPFHDHPAAERAWSEQTRRMVDVAQHRLFILTIPRPCG